MKNNIAVFIATLGVGKYLKMAATTTGIIYIPVVFFLLPISRLIVWNPLFYMVIGLVVLALGLWSIPIAERVLGPQVDPRGKVRDRDQNAITIDELLGFMVTCVPFLFEVPQTLVNFAIAYFAFRFFDIIKKAAVGARYFDNMKSALGVMLDDVVAGLWAGVVLYVLTLIL